MRRFLVSAFALIVWSALAVPAAAQSGRLGATFRVSDDVVIGVAVGDRVPVRSLYLHDYRLWDYRYDRSYRHRAVRQHARAHRRLDRDHDRYHRELARAHDDLHRAWRDGWIDWRDHAAWHDEVGYDHDAFHHDLAHRHARQHRGRGKKW